MKRIVAVLLGVLAGAVGVMIWFWACAKVGQVLFPPSLMVMPTQVSLFSVLGDFAETKHGRAVFISCVVLGAWSVILWRGERTFWPRLGSVLCSLGAMATPLWVLEQVYEVAGFSPKVFWLQVAYYAPLLLWSLGLFFIAVLARRRRMGGVL